MAKVIQVSGQTIQLIYGMGDTSTSLILLKWVKVAQNNAIPPYITQAVNFAIFWLFHHATNC